ncbi:MAG: NAD(P)-dependent oxidoreductase, partial [Bacteroidales bacterium]|nr:NAD(P)-dependent oxidoreductase [Bacteroidales bacterium]
MKKTIFLTGSTGIMGAAGLKEISQRLDRFNLTLLVRPSKMNRKKLAPYENNPNIRIIWGDLMNYEDMLNGVNGADYVLHVGGKVSPQCDAYPNETRTVNVTAVQHLVKAIKAQPDPDKVAFVYIGSVAQTGFRPVPYHFGRTGDPLNPSIYDHYALSKCMAERIVVESGLKKWVCLRQTGMLYTEIILKSSDPITFHVPLDGVQEWATTEDSGRLLANVCEDFIPEEFWNRFYNISSGPDYRLTFYDFETKLLKLLSCPPPEKIFDLKWFAIRNFHSYWFTDGDELEKYTHFRANIPLEEYFEKMRGQIPWFFAFAKIVPAFVIRF